MKEQSKRIISVLLAIAMIFSLTSVGVLAEEDSSDVETEIAEEVTAETGEESYVAEESTEEVFHLSPPDEKAFEKEIQEIFDEAILKQADDVQLFGDAASQGITGSGTEEDPYLVYTEAQLISFAVGNVDGGMSAYWSLQSDIVLTADTWAPVGAYDPFTGVFDGNGHTISSTKLFQSTAMSGVFGQNKGLIKNLNVNVTIEEVATNTGTLCATNYGRIENCHSTGSITTAENKYIGGLVGYNSGGTITNCSSAVLIDAPSSTVGGIAGYNLNGVIEYCASTADVEEADDGGLVGDTVGGITGYMYNNSTSTHAKISNCYSLGKIKGGNTVGGIVGYAKVYNNSYGYATIEYCYAKGVITKGNSKGGLTSGISSQDRVLIKYSYFNTVNETNEYGHSMSLLKFTDKTNFYDWDFEHVWNIASDKNGGYPYIDLRGKITIDIEGEGTEASPYIVTNEKQLCYIASQKLPNALGAHYKMANDIAVTANFWTPIGVDSTGGFTGVFDGNGYSITGVHLDNCYYNGTGLFGYNYGTIKNLNVEGWFSGNVYTGILCGYNSGTIDNCYTYIEDEDYKVTNDTNSRDVGGLVGNNRGVITKCGSSAFVEAPGANAGGLVGYHYNGTIKYSYATGDVTGSNAGGFVGYVENGSSSTVATISNCYAMGKVNGSNYTGGLVGYSKVYNGNYGYVHIEYCYARGLVTGGTNGGLLGGHNTRDRNRIRYCYYNNTNTGNRIGFAVSTADLKKQETFYGWDFDNIWQITKGVNTSYPHIDVRGETPKTVLKGNGEEDNPYLIYTEKDLRALVLDTYGNYDLSIKHFYKLMNDIEVTANFWTPIGGNATNAFKGIFDGNGYTISGLTLSNSEYQYTGLFGCNEGTIKNLNVEGDFQGAEFTGLLCGLNTGTIENCSSSGLVESWTHGESRYVGGLVGYHQNPGKIIDANSSATVNSYGSRTGGLVGFVHNALVEASYATGSVNGAHAGGLVGYLYNNDSSTTATIRNSYATGAVTGETWSGGPTIYTGGLVGYAKVNNGNYGYIHVEYCYATGLINNGTGGGLVGDHNTRDRVHVRYSYYNGANTGNRIGFSASLGQMATEELYYMWNFKNIWAIDPSVNNGYPYHNVNGKAKTHYLEGYGDEEDPYLIETEEDLWTLVLETYDLTTNFYYQLQNDIEITAEHWTPIGGNGRTVFKGIFDGNGYTISGLKLSNSEYQYTGLFGSNEGTIKNLNVEGYFKGAEYTGLLCGLNAGTIENCSSFGLVESWTHGESRYVGGLVGYHQNPGKIRYSNSSAKVDSYGSRTGGLVGFVHNALVEASYATGSVNGAHAGGLVGYLYNNNSGTTATIRNSFAVGKVTGETWSNGPTIYTGGLVGYTQVYNGNYGYTAINFCYSNGEVTGSNRGGLIGGSNSSTRNSVLSSYYNSTVTGLSDIDRGTPLSDDALKIKDSFVGWDFDNIWSIDSDINSGYAYLTGYVPEYRIDVTGVELDKLEISVEEGRTYTLTATVLPVNATNPEVSWSSKIEEVATVANGVVTGKKVGSTIITVTTLEGEFTATCKVTVTEKKDDNISVTGVSLNKTTANLTVGGTETLTATVTPDTATNKAITWESSNTSVATVENGKVTAKAAGTATITVTTSDGEFTATCKVTVTEAEPSIVKGDVNGDGDVDFADAILILKYDAGVTTLAGDSLKAADVNGDGDVDFVDAILILKYDSGLISSFN
ncbi:MAG: Ig domain-containing protein [Clostridia bacterium]